MILAGILIIQLPQVQTAVAEKVTGMLSEKLDGEITVEKIHLRPFNTIVLKNVLILDKNPAKSPIDSTLAQIDTFFRAGYVIARMSLTELLSEESIKIRSANVKNAQMNLVLEDLRTESDSIITYNNLSRIFRIKSDTPRSEPNPKEIFRINDICIKNMGFAMLNRTSRPTPYYGGINWNDLDIKNINLIAKDMYFKDGIMYGIAEKLSFREKNGFNVREMSGETRVGRGRTIVENLYIKDDWSDLHLKQYMMSYRNVEDFKDFIGLVKLDATILESVLDFRTIAYFAPQLEGNTLKADVSGTMSGPVSDFTVRKIRFSSHEGGFAGKVDGRIRGIPDTMDMQIDADVTNLRLSPDGLGKFVTHWIKGGKLDLSKFGKGMMFYGKASTRGYLNNLNTSVALSSKNGNLTAQARLDDLLKLDCPINISGCVSTEDLDLGKLTGAELAGPATARARLSLLIDENISVEMDTLKVSRLNIKGYDYKDILAKGIYTPLSLNATLISKDPNLNFIFQGGYAKSEKSQNTVFKINASVGHADLNAINIDTRGKSIIQLRTNADFTKTAKGDLLGRIDIGEIMMENKSGRYDIGDIVMTSYSTDDRYTARLKSKFANGSYMGTASIVDFIKDIKGITIDRELPALSNGNEFVWRGNSYEAELVCNNVQNLLSFAAPGLYIENGTSISAKVSPKGELDARMRSNRLAIRHNYLKDLFMTLDNASGVIKGELHCEEISAAGMTLKDNLLQLYADANRIGAGYSFDNHTDNETNGEFVVNGQISADEGNRTYELFIRPSAFKYNSKEWSIQPSTIVIDGRNINIDSFGAVSGEEFVSLHGRASENEGDILSLQLERFDLSAINALMPSDYGVRGAVTGTATLSSPMSDMNIDINLLCDSTYIANMPLGVITLGSEWNEEERKFDFFAQNELKNKRNLDISGYFKPKERILKTDIGMDRFQIGYAQPLMKDIFSEMNGYVSGTLSAFGPIDKMKIGSKDARLDDTWLKIAYTGVPYHAEGKFHIDETGVYFDDIAVKDRYDGTGKLTGSINYEYFRNFTFDTKIAVNHIEGIALKEKENESFYGNIFGTGNIHLSGPIESLVMNIDAVTAKPGQLHVPISSYSTSPTGSNLLKFKQMETFNHIDPYEIFMQKTQIEEKSPNEFTVKLNVTARPDVEAFVEIDKASGNVLSGRGSGNISLRANSEVFEINGDYRLEAGNYKFAAINIVNRDFKIQEGSNIRFNGDIMDSDLDIDAIYKTKASIDALISDTTSVANRRTVECGINIQGKLSSPQIGFSIEIPDLDPTIKSRVESALSTEDKVQKQFLSLLISNNFIPDEQSGIVDNTSTLYSNASEMVANQINNIFQKLNIPLDLGLRYQPNTRGNDIFDVAVSTQLFNNRVIVNGNIGNKQYSSGNTENEVVGDIDIEIKLDRSGAFRLNLFSHSADQYTNYLDNLQRNGVGITYQTEFNSFKQFFKNLFSSKKKRQQLRLEEEMNMKSSQMNTIDIQRTTN